MPKVMLHAEDAFDILKSPYRTTDGCWAMSCHDDMWQWSDVVSWLAENGVLCTLMMYT